MSTPIFTAVLFIIGKEGAIQMSNHVQWNIIQCFKKRKPFVTLADLEDIILSEISQLQKNYKILSYQSS
jgi:hypothetical protein